MRAFLISELDGRVETRVTERPEPLGEVVIDVVWSALNYKDALVVEPASRVRRSRELVGGVEAIGVVRSSSALELGTLVIVYGGDLGTGSDGGFAERMAAPLRYVTPLPQGTEPEIAIAMGLAGYTAMASIRALEQYGLRASDGEVLVTGASGGVGSLAVSLLARLGYRVVASTGSPEHSDWLQSIGAHRCIGREDISDLPQRTLGSPRWAGAIDCIGGATLEQVLRSLNYSSAVAVSGLVAGNQVSSSIYPFITRNVAMLGIDAVETPTNQRLAIWKDLAGLLSPTDLRLIETTIGLEGIDHGLATIKAGNTRGRWLVEPR